MTNEDGAEAAEWFMREARRLHPGHSDTWYGAWLTRLAHYKLHDGDMSGAPDLPIE